MRPHAHWCERRVTIATGPLGGAKVSVPHPVEADLSLSVAGGEVGLGLRRGALGADAIAHALVGTLRLLAALLVAALVRALGGAAGALTGAGQTERRRVRKWHSRAFSPRGNPGTVFIHLQTLFGFNLHFLLSGWLAS